MDNNEDSMYLDGYRLASVMVKLHPQWLNPWFIMGFEDGKGDIEIKEERSCDGQ